MKKSVFLILILAFSISNLLAQTFKNINAGLPGIKYSASSAWGDYDNDGLLDIVICGEPDGGIDTTLLFHNDGDEIFSAVVFTGFVDTSLGDLEWADFNNDGYLDLIMMGYYQEASMIKLYLNNGDATFTEQMGTGLPGVYMGDIDLADFNNDGFIDIGLIGFDNNYAYITKVFQNNQNSTFSEVNGLNLEGLNFGKFKWGDYTGDGYADFVVNGFGDESFVTELWKNNGDGTFTEATEVSLHQGWLGDMAWGDYDNDDDLDLIISGTGGSGVDRFTIIYTNNGNGTFTEGNGLQFPKVSHSSLEWGDFDGDNDLDLFISGTLDAMGTGNYIGEVRYNDEGNFSNSEIIIESYWGDCRVADFNADGYPDIFICGYDVTENGLAEIFVNERITQVDNNSQDKIKIGPIPAKEKLFIRSEQSITAYHVYLLTGEEIKNKQIHSKELSIDIKGLPAGIYILKLNFDATEVIRKITVL